MVMPEAAAAGEARDVPGWYGKLSSLGDFAQRRLPVPWVQACDAWLSSALQGSRHALGERWLEVYLTAPVMRFAWAPGVVDSFWWFGLLMPSCDSVGRYFPLMIAHPRMKPPEDRIALDHLELWYEHLAEAAVLTLQESDASVDTLEAALREAPPWPTPGRAPALAAQRGVQGEHLRLVRGAPLSHWLHGLAAQALASRLHGCTLWWRVRDSEGEDGVDLIQGLPDGAAFASLLAGRPGL
jgi:type VI secretion system protein ImpM